MEPISNQAVREFLDALASSAPVPGGGGASAVAAAVGVALGQMVAELTCGKKRYAEVQDRIDVLIPEAERIRGELLELAEKDAVAFGPLAKAYRLLAATEEERAYKAKVMEQALRDACDVPLAIMRKVCEAIVVVDELSQIGTRIAISDAGVGATLLEASLKAASLSIFINARSMRDDEYATRLERRAQDMLDEYCPRADAAFRRVEEGIRWQS